MNNLSDRIAQVWGDLRKVGWINTRKIDVCPSCERKRVLFMHAAPGKQVLCTACACAQEGITDATGNEIPPP